MDFIIKAIHAIYELLWGTLFTIPFFSSTLEISLLVLILVPSGILFTIKTRFFFIRCFKAMLKVVLKKEEGNKSLSGFQALIVSTATRVGMGNLVGVVAAISVGGAGAVFWMWVMALLNTALAFMEATLAQLHQRKDPLFGGFKGGPAYYLHDLFAGKKKYSILAIGFALSGLLCWLGISSVIGNSVTQTFHSSFGIDPLITSILLTILCALVVLSNKTVKVLDVLVPIMAVAYFACTLVIIILNLNLIPGVIANIISQAFGLQEVSGAGIGMVIMQGVKRGLFSNEAGSGSAPCASGCSEVEHPAESGLLQALGVLIDTIVICTCSAMIVLLVPQNLLQGLEGMELLEASMNYHMGSIGSIFIAIILLLFCFSTFLGILFYARCNISYMFETSRKAQTIYKILALIMLFIGGISSYGFVWELGDIGIALMTIFNIIALYLLSNEAINSLNDYMKK